MMGNGNREFDRKDAGRMNVLTNKNASRAHIAQQQRKEMMRQQKNKPFFHSHTAAPTPKMPKHEAIYAAGVDLGTIGEPLRAVDRGATYSPSFAG